MAEDAATVQAPPGRDLNDAIAACFAPLVSTPPFPDRLAELAMALTNGRYASVWRRDVEDRWATLTRRQVETDETLLADLTAELAEDRPNVRFARGHVAARCAMPDGSTGVLVMSLPPGNAAVQGLTYERISLLAHLSFSQFRNADLLGQRDLAGDLLSLAAGQPEKLQAIADHIATLTGASLATAGLYDGTRISQLAISGQDGFAKRAELPKRLRSELAETARLKSMTQDRVFAPISGRDGGLVLLVEDATRPAGLLPLCAAIFSQAHHGAAQSKWTAKRFVKLGGVALIMFGLAMIPIPDGVDLPARVEASTKRILTAPFTGVIAQVETEENAQIKAGQVVVRMDTREVDLDLIGVLAERASAVIEREAARASRNAAQLRNAELEVERLQARIDLLEDRKSSAVVNSAIDGIALLGDLKARVGATVRQGDILMEVADPNVLHLDLTVLETHVAKIAVGDTGTFRPDFNPTLSVDAEIRFVSPAIDSTQTPPRLTARAEFSGPPDALGPGLSGVLKIGDRYRPVWQVVYTNLRDWVLLRFWL